MKISNDILNKLIENNITPIIGNQNAKNIIYEFFDYNCGHCKSQFIVLNELLNKNKNIKIVLKSFPIFQISQIPARAIIAAYKQNKVIELNKAMFETSLIPLKYSQMEMNKIQEHIAEKILNIAKHIGIDTKKFLIDMQSEEIEKEINKTKEIAHQIGIHGTPALIINGNLYPGFIDIDEIYKYLI